ncbi:MAG TPA: hypothetical protein VIV15_03195 [Anaerolineales bacterium]
MKTNEFLHRIRSLFHHQDEHIPDEIIQNLIRSLQEDDQEKACTCDDVFAVLDQYAELELRGQDAARIMPLLRKHMDGCHDCCEEYEALLEILQKTKTT